MKTIKKWDTFRETILESNEEEEIQTQKDEAKEDDKLEIKSGDEIKTEEDLKDFFNIDK